MQIMQARIHITNSLCKFLQYSKIYQLIMRWAKQLRYLLIIMTLPYAGPEDLIVDFNNYLCDFNLQY